MALPLTPEDEVVDLTPSPEDGLGPSNAGRYVVSQMKLKPKLSRQANFEEYDPPELQLRPVQAFSEDIPYVDEIHANCLPMYNIKRLNLHRPKSVSECVHFSYSCSELSETTFTVPVEINKFKRDQSTCSSIPPSSSSRETETQLVPVTFEVPLEESPIEELSEIRVDSEAICHSDRSECTPTEDLYYYTDCQALFNTNSATGDEIFYSQLEDLTLSTISISEDFPTDVTEPNHSTFCCDVFTQGIKEETKSVLEEDLKEDQTNAVDFILIQHDANEPSIQAPVKSTFSDCFPI